MINLFYYARFLTWGTAFLAIFFIVFNVAPWLPYEDGAVDMEGWGITMFHAIHCLQMIREIFKTAALHEQKDAFVERRREDHSDHGDSHHHGGSDTKHATHCLSYLYQMVLKSEKEPLNSVPWKMGDTVHDVFSASGIQDDAQVIGYPVRREIDHFAQSGPPFDLFILALQALQAREQNDPLSYFQIAGIHGYPVMPWNGVEGNGTYPGYCTHESVTFPTWHRVYMALFEQVIQDTAYEIAKKYPSEDRHSYEDAAKNLRIPYWDWIEHPRLPLVATTPEIRVRSPKGWQYTQNPLYNYTFHPGPEGNSLPDDSPIGKLPWTVRWFDKESQTSNHTLANEALGARAPLVLATTFSVFNYVSHYNDFACIRPHTSNPYQNIELLHNTIHNAVGGNLSHIKQTELSAFDPLFYLHHVNLDRLFALWQVLHPDSRFEPEENIYGSYVTQIGSVDTLDTGKFALQKPVSTLFLTAQD
ncbi:hypothetical protein J7T55_015304 [Diaporthe amygdali]|uniref:uncharacterized protein n=1 Tax=Phomopsis amygdali TaxID=1214568 RepID=UPI0022FDEC04|nr:uncharacterized protein J7T55_015304 [Diaporthe amygdali]KAJ0120575.1 hypothetical protein J7T55_015304 [Diaporthe amygdali]